MKSFAFVQRETCVSFVIGTQKVFVVIVNGRKTNTRVFKDIVIDKLRTKVGYDEFRRTHTEMMVLFIIFIQCIMIVVSQEKLFDL